jgi:hypothetical protein
MTPEEHTRLLRAFEVDRLLKLLALEAKKQHDGHYAIFSCTTGFQVAFGTPDVDGGQGRDQLRQLPAWKTLKEALIAALVSGHTFADYGEGHATRHHHGGLVGGRLTFSHHGRQLCQGEVLWAHEGASPLGFWCECGAAFLFTVWDGERVDWQRDPIGQALMHIHTAHHVPVEVVFDMFTAFPEAGAHLFARQAAGAGAGPTSNGEPTHE